MLDEEGFKGIATAATSCGRPQLRDARSSAVSRELPCSGSPSLAAPVLPAATGTRLCLCSGMGWGVGMLPVPITLYPHIPISLHQGTLGVFQPF